MQSIALCRGKHSEGGQLEVEYGGCTPAYAGKEVNRVKDMVPDGTSREEMMKILRAHPLDASSHDLLASGLTIFAGVFGKWQSKDMLFWQGEGAEGLGVLKKYWCK